MSSEVDLRQSWTSPRTNTELTVLFQAASLHIGLSTPNFTILEMSLGMHYNTEAGDIDLNTYLKDQSVFAIDGGHVKAPTGFGLGIEVDEEMIRKISAETQPWPPKEFFGPDGSIREW